MPERIRLVRSVVTVWILVHVPLALSVSTRYAVVAREAFGYMAFAVLFLVFQSTYTTAFEKLLAQIPLNYTLLFVVMLIIPLPRFIAFASVTCGGMIAWVIVEHGKFPYPHEMLASVSVAWQVAAQWIVSILLGSLLEWHRSHLVRTREEIARLNVELQHEVQDQTAVIRKQEESIARTEKLHAIGTLAGGIAHDFNNKLTVILGYCEILLGRPALDHQARRWLSEMHATAEQAAVMTRQLLSFGGREAIHPRPVDLSSFIEERLPMVERLVGPRVTVELELDRRLARVHMDPGQVDQVLMNLVLNARDAMPQCGRLTLRTARSGETIGGHPMALLAVEDTGIGMDEAVMSRIFEPFFTTKEKGSGTGLGLASVYGIVRQNGGDIRVASEPGQGSTFSVLLPLSEGEAAAADAARADGPAPRAVILVVEDEPRVRQLIKEALESRGHRVEAAGDGDEAVRICAAIARPPDLVLCDVMMPGMPVADLAARLHGDLPGVPIVWMSGYADRSAQDLGLLVSGTRFLRKPFTVASLFDTVDSVLRERPGA